MRKEAQAPFNHVEAGIGARNKQIAVAREVAEWRRRGEAIQALLAAGIVPPANFTEPPSLSEQDKGISLSRPVLVAAALGLLAGAACAPSARPPSRSYESTPAQGPILSNTPGVPRPALEQKVESRRQAYSRQLYETAYPPDLFTSDIADPTRSTWMLEGGNIFSKDVINLLGGGILPIATTSVLFVSSSPGVRLENLVVQNLGSIDPFVGTQLTQPPQPRSSTLGGERAVEAEYFSVNQFRRISQKNTFIYDHIYTRLVLVQRGEQVWAVTQKIHFHLLDKDIEPPNSNAPNNFKKYKPGLDEILSFFRFLGK